MSQSTMHTDSGRFREKRPRGTAGDVKPSRGPLAIGLALAGVSVWVVGWMLMAGALASTTGSEGDLGVLGIAFVVEGLGTISMLGLGIAAAIVGTGASQRAGQAKQARTVPVVAVLLGLADLVLALASPVGSIAWR